MAHALPTGRGLGDLVRNGTLAQAAAVVVGATFLLVGILGFIPGITTNYGDMTFAGHESEASLFGIFDVSILHNIVHLLFGIVGLALARTVSGARLFLIGGGAIYLVLWLYGLVINHGSGANFAPTRSIGASSQSNAFSCTTAAISAPYPIRATASCATTQRFVFFTDPTRPSSSSGCSVRGSKTSTRWRWSIARPSSDGCAG